MFSTHNTRILRFLIVLIAVILTILIYASYSTTSTLTPSHMRMVGPLPPQPAAALFGDQQLQQQQLLALVANQSTSSNYLNNNNYNLTHNNASGNSFQHQSQTALKSKHRSKWGSGSINEVSYINRKRHREPTIDADAPGGGDGGAVNGNDGVVGDVTGGVVSSNGAAGADNYLAAEIPDEMGFDHFVGNDLLEEQYAMQSVDNLMGNINNTTSLQTQQAPQQQPPNGGNQQNSQQHQQQQQQQQLQQTLDNNINNINKIPDSDVLIPTSNLQKFIENADKILKNMTNANAPAAPPADAVNVKKVSAAPPSPAKVTEELSAVAKQENEENDDETDAKPPSVIMTIKSSSIVKAEKPPAVAPAAPVAPVTAKVIHPAKKIVQPSKKSSKQALTAPVDPTQGILAHQIYESGHQNEDIDFVRICPNNGEHVKLLVLITSAQSHRDARLAIRQTWGHYTMRRDVGIAFILGRNTNASMNLALKEENLIYGDLIRGNFIDSYNNLTLKTMSALEWIDEHCSKARFILKTDDDMFINIPKLLQFVDTKAQTKRVIYGRLAKKWKPIRNKKSKYYVSNDQFSAALFPPFTTGPAYVLTSDIVHELYMRSLQTVYLKLEDVFTTGIVAQQLGIKRVHVNEFLNRRISFNPCNIRNAISVHMIKSNEQFDLWKKLLDLTTKCK